MASFTIAPTHGAAAPRQTYKMNIFLSVFTDKFICNTDRPLSICKFWGPQQIDRQDFLLAWNPSTHTMHKHKNNKSHHHPTPHQLITVHPWHHLPQPLLMAPPLPMSPYQAPCAGSTPAAAVYVVGAPKCDPSKKRERDNTLALGGRRFTIITNNQLIFRVSNRGIDKGPVGGAGRGGGRCTMVLEPANPVTKCGLRRLPETMFQTQ